MEEKFDKKEYNKKYYAEHRDSILAKQHDYVANNSEKVCFTRQVYYQMNKDKLKEKSKNYYLNKKSENITE